MKRGEYSMPWQKTATGWEVPGTAYTITSQHSSSVLRYDGTLVHTGFNDEDAKIEADRHRGINRPAWRP